MVEWLGLEIYKSFSLLILPGSNFNFFFFDALEYFKTKRRSWNHLPPGPLPLGK